MRLLTVHFVIFFNRIGFGFALQGQRLQMTCFFLFLANPRSLSPARILCKHDKFWSMHVKCYPQMRRCYFYCLCWFEGLHLSRDSPHCVLSQIWFYETLNLRLRSRGGSRCKPTLDASLPGTLLSSTIHFEARSKNSACQIAVMRRS